MICARRDARDLQDHNVPKYSCVQYPDIIAKQMEFSVTFGGITGEFSHIGPNNNARATITGYHPSR
jgi:hypothetical protein